jgi:AAA family ATP:ADP antiporter
MEKNDQEILFGKWRSRLWPIHRWELKKILPLFLMKFFISFNYGILTSLKDTLIVTEKSSGAEVIPILKGWIVLPIAIVASIIYAKLSNHFKNSTIFYSIIIFFISFFAVYAFFLYPNKEWLSPHTSANWLTENYGEKYKHWIAIYRHWPHVLFFVFAELWGSIVFFLLFWGFANQISKIHEAKRFYTIYSAVGNLGAICTGPLVWYYAYKFIQTEFTMTIQCLVLFVIVFGFIIMLCRWRLSSYILKDTDKDAIPSKNEGKTSLSLFEGLKFVAKSKYLRSIAIMVIGYGLTINLIEVTWKANLKIHYPNPADYQAFMGSISFYVGVISFLCSLFVGGNVIRYFGWRFSAMIAPIIVGATGLMFFVLVLFQNKYGFIGSFLGISTITIIIFGAFQNIFSKSIKYSFFDPTKEMAFIPLDKESKIKGKAAIDVVGSRLGKSGAAWIQIILIELATTTGSVLSITHLLIPIVIFAVFYWIFAIKSLHKDLHEHIEPRTIIEKEPIST